MFGRSRRDLDGVRTKFVAPWEDGNLRAEWALVPLRFRKQAPCVVITGPSVVARMLADDVRGLVGGKQGIADSVDGDSPTSFLCRPEAVDPSSPARTLIEGVPLDALVLLVEAEDFRLAAVLSGPAEKSFTAWVSDLPS